MNDEQRRVCSAISRNDTDAMTQLIESGVNVNFTPLPLRSAAALGRVELMRLLLDAGADIDAVENGDETACYAAIRYDRYDALKLLVERGAKVRIPRNRSLMKLVSLKADERMKILLLDAGAPLDDLTCTDVINLVHGSRSPAVVEALVARNFPLADLRDREMRTMCHRVIWHRTHNVNVEGLLRALVNVAGVDINAVDSRRHSALHESVFKRDATALRVLIELGADIEARDGHGLTALNLAAGIDRDDDVLVELLLATGADVHSTDNYRQKPCHKAAHGCTSLCLILAVGGVGDLDLQCNSGSTPRSIAVSHGAVLPTAAEIDTGRQRIARTQLSFVRQRAFEICVGLQSLRLSALQLCEILIHSCGRLGSLIAFHQWWEIATAVKHFRDKRVGDKT